MTNSSGRWRRVSNILTLVFASLVGCSSALDYKVAELTDQQRATLRQILTTNQLMNLDDWVNRETLANHGIPATVTVRQALNYQAEWLTKHMTDEAKAADVTRKAQATRKARQEEIAGMLSVTLLSKTNKVQVDERRFVALEISYGNNTNKDIQRVEGLLKLTDIYGNTAMYINRSFDRTIPAKQTVVDHDAGVFINPVMDTNVNLWNSDFDKLKCTFEPQTILFNDGTIIRTPPD